MELTLLHSERPKLYTIMVFLSAIGFNSSGILQALVSKSSNALNK